MKLLLVEDDVEIADFLRRGLAAEGYAVDVVGDGQPALDAARRRAYDLVLLDLLLPEVDGLTVCRALREEQPSLMILMLTARDSRDDKVLGLRSGADDYLTKPFDFAELLARIEALLRRVQQSPDEPATMTLGDLVIDRRRKLVTCGERDLGLTATELSLFLQLVEKRGEVSSRDDLMREVWRRSVRFQTNLVDVYVRYLRRKLEAAGSLVTIATVRGFGYMLEAPVAEDQEASPPPLARAP